MNRSVSLPDDWVEQSESGALADHRHPVSGEEVEVRYRLDPEQDAVRQKPVAVRYAVPDGDDVVEYEERFSTLGDAKRFLGQAGVDVSVEPYEHLDVRGPMERVAYADYLTGEGVPDLEVPEAVQRRRAASVAADGGGAYAFPDAVTVHRLEPVDGDGAAVSADGVVVEWEDRPYLVTLDGETAPRGTRNGHRAVPVTARDIDASGGTYTTRNGVTEEGVEGFVDKVWEQERLHIPLRDGGD